MMFNKLEEYMKMYQVVFNAFIKFFGSLRNPNILEIL